MESIAESPAARKVAEIAKGRATDFLDNVDDLMKALKDVDSPDAAKLRAKVRIALAAAKSAATDTASQFRSQALHVSRHTNGLIRDYPWAAIGIATVIGLAVGVAAARRS